MDKEKLLQITRESKTWSPKRVSNYRMFYENRKNISIIRREKKKSMLDSEADKWLTENFDKIISTSKNINFSELSVSEKTIKLVDLFLSDTDQEINRDTLCSFFEILQSITKLTTKEIDCMLEVFVLRIIKAIAKACQNDKKGLPKAIKRIYEVFSVDFEAVSTLFSPLEKKLRSEKSGIYPKMTKETQKLYRRKLVREAKQSGKSVEDVCEEKLKVAEEKGIHFGFLLKKKRKKHFYYPVLIIFYMFLLADFAFAVENVALTLLLALPLYYFCKGILDFICAKSVKNEILPSLRIENVTSPIKTAVVITALVASEKDVSTLTEKIRRFKINNKNTSDELYFGLLCDFPESSDPHCTEDEVLTEKIERSVNKLNEEDPCFFAAVRKKVFHKSEGKYVGWERKRGAIESFIHWLNTGNLSQDMCLFGCKDRLCGAEYLITLDTDTQLGIGQAKELIGIASHPCNRPVIKEVNGKMRVVSGHGIIQPKMTTSLLNPIQTPFGKIFSNGSGEVLYSGASFDFMQSLYQEGNFCGKGIIHVASYEKTLNGVFPEQRILSHDMPEGSILRCGLASNVYFSDSEPQDARSYYKRQHRWIRGDVQNLALLSELTPLRRVILFENVGRYLVPLSEFFLLFAASFAGTTATVVSIFLILLFHLRSTLESLLDLLLQRNFQIFHRRFFTKMRNLLLNALYKSYLSVSAIAFEAYYYTDAVIRALYRMIFSKKKLLEWQVYTPFFEKKEPLIFYVPSVFVTIVFLVFCRSGFSLLFALIWLIYPLLMIKISTPYRKKKGWNEEEKKRFCEYAKREFKYFDACVGEKTRYLPPDNIQIQPYEKIALRTSPTNIGMYLVSLAAAKDFGVISFPEFVRRVDRTMGSVQVMEHAFGHLYNWYDIENLSVIGDRFVSTVDSGNFIASLVCVRSALKEEADPDGSVSRLVERIDREINGADFKPLFDYEKRLFYVGYFPEKKEKTSAHYDHYMSEARITMFLCIALGQIPSASWSALSRPLLSFNGNVGIGSWSGTTFEYFMPSLFLPVIPNSIEDESLEFAFYCQKRFGANHVTQGTVFGISESGYTLTDDFENFQYKAFGVPYLSVQAENSFPKVISPYSSFLMLERKKKDVPANLDALEKMGLVGEYGYFEACEFNSNFIDDYKVVASYMSHHKGMSIISLANAAFDNVFVKRFLAFRDFSAKIELLSERFPIEGIVLKKKRSTGVKEYKFSLPNQSVKSIDSKKSSGRIYSDGKATLLAFSDGTCRVLCNEKELFDPEKGGIVCRVETATRTYSFTDTECDKRFIKLSDSHYELSLKSEKVLILLHAQLLGGKNAVLFRLELNGISEKCKVIFSAPIILQKLSEYRAHPAFCALSLEGKSDGKTLTVRRRGVENHQYLHILSSVEFQTKFMNRREEKSFDYTMLYTPDVELIFSANSAEQRSFPLIFVLSDRENAPEFSLFANERGEVSAEIAEKTNRSIRRLGEICSYDKDCGVLESELLVNLQNEQKMFYTDDFCSVPQSYLWQYGISGDAPIVAMYLSDDEKSFEVAETMVRVYKKMRISGIAYDLVLIRRKDGGYFDATRDRFTNIILETKCEFLLGKHPGIHFVDIAEENDLRTFYLLSRYAVNFPKTISTDEVEKAAENEIVKALHQSNAVPDQVGTLENEGFTIDKEKYCPDLPFSHIVSNRTTGFVCNQNSLGFTWHRNAGLKRLSKWENCPGEGDGEKLYLHLGSGSFDLLQTAVKVCYKRHFAVYDGQVLGSEYKVVVTASERLASKAIFVFLDEKLSELGKLEFSFVPACGTKSDRNIVLSDLNGAIRMESIPHGEYVGGAFFAAKETKTVVAKKDNRLVLSVPAKKENALFFGGYTTKEHLLSSLEKIERLTVEEILSDESLRFERYFQEKCGGENFWIRYQTIHSRYFGRTGLYQSSGAYGYRDQLQDCLIFLDTDPKTTREHILRAASHQYAEGDVQHWWHPNRKGTHGNAGIRSRCSDDYLWLIYVCDQYLKVTGDLEFLNVKAPFLTGERLSDGEDEIYHVPTPGDPGTIREHLSRAAKLFIERGLGPNHLPWIGSGDWNDGMNRIDGESVWLGFFGAICLNRVRSYLPQDQQNEILTFLEELSDGLRGAFQGSWFIRAIRSDGNVFGSDVSLESECSMDLITQAFAAFYQMEFAGTKFALKDQWVKEALMSAYENLVDEKNGTCSLFKKPFAETKPSPGYIQRYVAGVRENGGQYTHAAVWYALALLRFGKKSADADLVNMAKKLEKLISPFERLDYKKFCRYQREPYVLCGDVYSAKTMKGHGGWSWYTGAAGWYLRLREELDTLEKEGC